MTVRPTEALTSSSFRHLVDDYAAELSRAGVVATYAWTVGGRRSPGATWISLASSAGHGRLIRYPDGSFDSVARRESDDGPLLTARGGHVSRADFLALVASLGPAPQAHDTVTGRSVPPRSLPTVPAGRSVPSAR